MRKTREAEFIALMAAMMSMVALAIDAVLPAFSVIAQDFGVAGSTDIQLIVTLVLGGITLGQLIYGPIADRVGRKPAFAIGMVFFLVGSLLSANTNNFGMLLIGRFLQGFGAASFRISAMTIVRDQFEGAEMARITSFAMSLFMVVPCLAPLMGQATLYLFDWPAIFVAQFVLGVGLIVWFWARQIETMPERDTSNRVAVVAAFCETLTTPVTLAYMIAAGLMLGSFTGYLISSHHIFVDLYGAGDSFALYFAAVSIMMGAASFTNGRIVRRFGPKLLAQTGLCIAVLTSGSALVFLWYFEMNLIWFLVFITTVLSCMGFVFGNMNAIAVLPLGHIAGVASSMISFVSGAISVGLGSLIGSKVNALSPAPLFVGVFVATVLAFLIVRLAECANPASV